MEIQRKKTTFICCFIQKTMASGANLYQTGNKAYYSSNVSKFHVEKGYLC